jgi:hypothetical protein
MFLPVDVLVNRFLGQKFEFFVVDVIKVDVLELVQMG